MTLTPAVLQDMFALMQLSDMVQEKELYRLVDRQLMWGSGFIKIEHLMDIAKICTQYEDLAIDSVPVMVNNSIEYRASRVGIKMMVKLGIYLRWHPIIGDKELIEKCVDTWLGEFLKEHLTPPYT